MAESQNASATFTASTGVGDQRRPKTQEERKAESERAIIRAARKLFAAQGYVRTTLAEVGSLAGYTGGLVSHRFGSKQELLRAVFQQSSKHLQEDQLAPALAGKPPTEALKAFIATYLKEVATDESHLKALYVITGEALGTVDEIQTEVADFNRSIRSWLVDIIRAGIETGEFSEGIGPEDAAMLIYALLHGVTIQHLADPKRVRLKQGVAKTQMLALDSLKR